MDPACRPDAGLGIANPVLANNPIIQRSNAMKTASVTSVTTWKGKRSKSSESSPTTQTKFAALVCIAATVFAWSDQAVAQQPDSGSCSQRLTHLAHGLGLAVELAANQGPISARAHGGRIRIVCLPDAASPMMILSYPSEYPPRSFYEFVGEATALASDSLPDQMQLRAHRCHRAAKRAQQGYSLRRFQTFRLECHRDLSRSVFTIRPRSATASVEPSRK